MEGGPMPIADIPILSMLRTRMQWHQERQRVLAENVANADTPHYQARDLTQPDFGRSVRLASLELDRTSPEHLVAETEAGSGFAVKSSGQYEVRPGGNAVSLEDEMIKVADNQMDYEAVSSLYTRSLSLVKMAIGKA
jgi:flagellar basal-body rod protein FlgB